MDNKKVRDLNLCKLRILTEIENKKDSEKIRFYSFSLNHIFEKLIRTNSYIASILNPILRHNTRTSLLSIFLTV